MQKTIQADAWPTVQCFKYVLLTQPDADDVPHLKWMEKLAKVETVFVTMSKSDKVLRKSTQSRPDGCKALGLVPKEFSTMVTYIDLSNAGVDGKNDKDHEVFGKNAMNGQVYVCEFFTQVLTGKPVVMNDSNVESGNNFGQVILKNKKSTAAQNPCLKAPKLPAPIAIEHESPGG